MSYRKFRNMQPPLPTMPATPSSYYTDDPLSYYAGEHLSYYTGDLLSYYKLPPFLQRQPGSTTTTTGERNDKPTTEHKFATTTGHHHHPLPPQGEHQPVTPIPPRREHQPPHPIDVAPQEWEKKICGSSGERMRTCLSRCQPLRIQSSSPARLVCCGRPVAVDLPAAVALPAARDSALATGSSHPLSL